MTEPILAALPADTKPDGRQAGDLKLGSDEFFHRAQQRLNFHVPPALTDPSIVPASGDQGTDRMWQIIAEEQPVRPAAVLIPVVERDEPTVLLTQRSPHLSSHAGQISFPGGKIDVTDKSPLDAALREGVLHGDILQRVLEVEHTTLELPLAGRGAIALP